MGKASRVVAAAALCCAVANAEAVIDRPSFSPSSARGHFVEQFTDDWSSRWSPSEATKETSTGGETFSYVGKWSVEEPHVYPGIDGDKGLVVKSKAAHHAISVPFDTPLDNTGKTLVVQYEVKLQKGLECGGAYLKLLKVSPTGIQAQEFSDKTEYSIMFGPDRCGPTNKVHFIFRHKNPLTGEYEEKHLKVPPVMKNVKTTALYTLIVKPDQTYIIKINDEEKKSGSLLTDFDPPVNPSKEIDDPEDRKPDDWVDQAKIADPAAVKPADWDEDAPLDVADEEAEKPDGWLDNEPLTVPDPDAEKPEEWDDEEDGDWVAPSVPNPKCEDAPGCGPWIRPTKPNPDYKGKWYAPLIDNPLFKGVWAPRKISNPKFYEDSTPANFEPINGLGIEIWTMQEDILFDNIYIGHSIEDAEAFAKETFHVKEPIERAAEDAEAPKPPSSPDVIPENFKSDPVGWIRGHVQKFIDRAVVDPKAAVQEMPAEAGALVLGFLTLLGMLSALLGLVSPSSPAAKAKAAKAKEAVAKKTDAIVADDTVDSGDKPVQEALKDAPLAAKKPAESEVKKRK